MPVKQDLLKILCCPVTKVELKILPNEMRVELNEKIQKGLVKSVGKKIVEEPLEEALITVDTKTVYRVTSNIPHMIPSEGIPVSDEDLVSKP
jgi:uncharacterized protein YbaR (Trm112 family)